VSTPRDPASRQEPLPVDFARIRLREPAPRAAPSAHGRAWRGWALAGLGLLVVLVLLFRGPLAGHVMPQTRAQRLVNEGLAALEAGHLTAADGSGARELLEAAIAIDPDRPEARSALARVAQAALRDAGAALAQDRFEAAHAALRLARELSVPRADADAVEAQLRERESTHAGIDALLARAETAREQRRFDGGDDAALPLYARILALQPRHAEALRGREDAIGALLEEARERLRQGGLDSATRAIAIATRYDPGHVDLPDTQARLTEELDATRRRADEALARGRIEQAVAIWRRLLDRDPADAAALAGLRRAADQQAERARRLASDFRFAEADAALRMAMELAPDSAAVRAAAAQVEQSRRVQRGAAPAMPVAERRRRVAQLLQDVADAEARGDLLAPPGDSAYDKLRAAQALAPTDPEVRAAGRRLLPAARRCFEEGLRANDLGRAGNCLDARTLLGEDATEVASARRRLAQRWLAIADERLAAGRIDAAHAALQAAHGLDPGVPGLAEFRGRMQAVAPAD
jgi:tetratricopeptide (TPR) repeat protein